MMKHIAVCLLPLLQSVGMLGIPMDAAAQQSVLTERGRIVMAAGSLGVQPDAISARLRELPPFKGRWKIRRFQTGDEALALSVRDHLRNTAKEFARNNLPEQAEAWSRAAEAEYNKLRQDQTILSTLEVTYLSPRRFYIRRVIDSMPDFPKEIYCSDGHVLDVSDKLKSVQMQRYSVADLYNSHAGVPSWLYQAYIGEVVRPATFREAMRDGAVEFSSSEPAGYHVLVVMDKTRTRIISFAMSMGDVKMDENQAADYPASANAADLPGRIIHEHYVKGRLDFRLEWTLEECTPIADPATASTAYTFKPDYTVTDNTGESPVVYRSEDLMQARKQAQDSGR